MRDINEIIQGCLKNDRKSQFRMYDYCFDCMMSVCVRYEKNQDDALAVLNTAFIKVLKHLGSYNTQHSLKPWVRRITVNVAIDRYRQKKREREVVETSDGDFEQANGHYAASETENWVESDHLKDLLHSLKGAERAVFNLFAIDGYSHKEIAKNLNITERSSIRHLTNARRKLQDQLLASEIGTKKA